MTHPLATVDVVVVTFSPGASLSEFLDTLDKATTTRVRIVLADNGSTDGVVEVAAAARDDTELLRTGGNLGYGRAANAGVAIRICLRFVGAATLLVIVNDCVLLVTAWFAVPVSPPLLSCSLTSTN